MDHLQSGQILGPYRIINQIGQGGMATVYKAYHAAMDRYVALKILPRQLAETPEFTGRFRQEARTIANLEHPHILPVHDYGESDGITYLVMRYLEAGTLKDYLQSRVLPLPEIDRLFSQLAGALGYAHTRGVVHRDLKPANVLVDTQGNCFLTDFGIAKILESTAHFTNTGGLIGTPAYMSPEQAMGQTVDQRADIYSLGIMLYEMVTGRVPFRADTPLAVALMHVNEALPLPSTVKPDISPAIERVILKALAKSPDDRFASAADFLAAWETALAEGVAMEESYATALKPDSVSALSEPIRVTSTVAPPAKPAADWGITIGVIALILVALAAACGLLGLGGLLVAPKLAASVNTPLPSATPFVISMEGKDYVDVPEAGPGKIEVMGQEDRYAFQAEAGQRVYFQVKQAPTSKDWIRWYVLDEVGNKIVDTWLQFDEPGVKLLEHGGLYTIIVGEPGKMAAGSYQLRLWKVAPPDQFSIALDEIIASETPGPGAGNIEMPGAMDIYTFTAEAGQLAYFQVKQQPTTRSIIRWQFTDALGTELFNSCLQCGDPGVKLLEHGGEYILTVGSEQEAATGTYQFKIWGVAPPERFTIQIGDTVANGQPGPGAGNLEMPGAKDIYTFTAKPGQQVNFQMKKHPEAAAQVNWRLEDEKGNEIFNTCLGCTNPGLQTLERGGTYTIIVGEDKELGTGIYQFQLTEP